MAEVTSELLLEVLTSIQRDAGLLRDAAAQTRKELIAMRGHLNAIQQDVHTIHGILARQDDSLDRIDRRLDLADAH